jgi:hypothetical protein
VIDYRFEHKSEQRYRGRAEMTTIITREIPTELVVRRVPAARPGQDVRRRQRPHRPHRPHGAALPHRGTGVLMSRASHRRRPITPAATVVLALVAAAITLWLGYVAQLGAGVGSARVSTAVPNQLAVVQVQSGESLQQLARRIAPDAPTAAMVDQIRELNELPSSAVNAGQTLIAPVG